MIRRNIRLETAELLRVNTGDDFIQVVILFGKEKRAFFFWYCAHPVQTRTFGATIRRLLTDYDKQLIAGY